MMIFTWFSCIYQTSWLWFLRCVCSYMFVHLSIQLTWMSICRIYLYVCMSEPQCQCTVNAAFTSKPSKPNVINEVLSSSGPSLTSWLTPGQVYEKSREDPEIGFVMGFWKISFQARVVRVWTWIEEIRPEGSNLEEMVWQLPFLHGHSSGHWGPIDLDSFSRASAY